MTRKALLQMRIAAIINTKAGTAASSSPHLVARRLSAVWKSFGHEVDIVVADGKDVGRAVRAACHDPRVQAVVICGGDGSLSRSLKHVVGTGKLLGVLPLGSMNYMARQLGVPFDLEIAAAALGNGVRIDIDLARVNHRMFLIRACFGAFAEFNRERDKARHKGGDILGAVVAGLAGVARHYPLVEGELRGPRGRARIATTFLMISNNLCEDSDPLLLQRRVMDGGALGVYVGRGSGPLDLAVLGLQAAMGRWSSNEGLVSGALPWVEIHTVRRQQTLSIDGDAEKMDGPFRFDVLPRALPMLVPMPAAGGNPE